MILDNKIRPDQQTGQNDLDPFSNDNNLGLFTFYQLQDPRCPFKRDSIKAIPSKCRTPHRIPFQHPNKNFHNTVTINTQRSPINRIKFKPENTQQVSAKISMHMRLNKDHSGILEDDSRIQFIPLGVIKEDNFDIKFAQRQQTTEKTPLRSQRYKTECRKQQDFKVFSSKPFRSVHLVKMQDVSTQGVKQIFKPKKQVISKILHSSLSSNKILQLLSTSQNISHSEDQKYPIFQVQSSSPQKHFPKQSPPGDKNGFLNYFFQQKNILTKQFLKARQTKKLSEILTPKARAKGLKNFRINNSPIIASNNPFASKVPTSQRFAISRQLTQ